MIAKRKGEITLASRRGPKESAEQRREPMNKNRVLQQLRAEGHLRVEPGPHSAKRHYTAEPLPDDEEEDEDE